MTKSELMDLLTLQTGLPRKRVEQAVNLVFDAMAEALVRGDRIEIRGFGSFKAKHYPAYSGRNPKTGDTIYVESKVLPAFKVGKELRARVNDLDPADQAAPVFQERGPNSA